MDRILEIVKFFAILQLILIAMMLLLMYLTRGWMKYREKQIPKKRLLLKTILDIHLNEQQPLTPKATKVLKKSLPLTIDILNTWNQADNYEQQRIQSVSLQLQNKVLLPAARGYARSRNWLKRFLAIQSYSFGFEDQDETRLLRLLQDPTMLVSINAAMVGTKAGSDAMVNAMLTFFSKVRRLQQSVFADIVARSNREIAPIIVRRLETESDIWTRVFCYRLLARLPACTLEPPLQIDFETGNTDLKIAVLHFIKHHMEADNSAIVFKACDSSQWEVRASGAQIAGFIPGEKSLHFLTQLITDSNWWVRINAARALAGLGQPGITVLKHQSPEKDRFAFETAETILKTLDTL